MDTDQAAPTLCEEPAVLFEAADHPFMTVPVADAVGRHHSHADLGAGICDDGERSLDGVRCLVVVDDRRGAGFERFESTQLRRPFEHLEIERGVEPPPDLIEDPLEVGCDLGWCRHPSRQFGVEVVVGADEAWGDVVHVVLLSRSGSWTFIGVLVLRTPSTS